MLKLLYLYKLIVFSFGIAGNGSDGEKTGTEDNESSDDESSDDEYADDLDELYSNALTSLSESAQNKPFSELSPRSKLLATCKCGECGCDARNSHHSCSVCDGKMMVCIQLLYYFGSITFFRIF